jgi:hypothetical protein
MPVSLMVLFLSSFAPPADLLLCDKQLFVAAIGRADLGEVKPSLFANRNEAETARRDLGGEPQTIR